MDITAPDEFSRPHCLPLLVHCWGYCLSVDRTAAEGLGEEAAWSSPRDFGGLGLCTGLEVQWLGVMAVSTAGTPGLWSDRAQGRGRAGPTCGLGTPGPPSPSTQPPRWREAGEAGQRVTTSALRRQEAAWRHPSAFGVSLEEAPLFKGLNITPVKFVCATEMFTQRCKEFGLPRWHQR